MTTDGDSKRTLAERKDPGASAGCSLEQGYPAGAIQYHLRGLAHGRLAETPPDQALASAPIPQFRWPGHPRASQVDQARSRADRAAGAARACTAASRRADPAPAVTPCITQRLRTGKKTAL